MTLLDTGTDKLLAEIDGGLGIVTFNQPEKHNVLSREMREALPILLATLQADPSVRVVVLAGAGEKAFMAGADISEFASMPAPSVPGGASIRTAVTDPWTRLEKPILAMIRGYCLGGGVLIALEADIRIASEDARFGIPAARLGAGYPLEGVQKLVAQVGPAHASDILFSGRRFGAEEALAMGLVNRVVPADELHPVVMAQARSIADNAPLTVAAAKFAIAQARLGPDRIDDARMGQLIDACFASEDFREGQAAFREKRSPRFTGR
jgi:enoyl-CoA hydratase